MYQTASIYKNGNKDLRTDRILWVCFKGPLDNYIFSDY